MFKKIILTLVKNSKEDVIQDYCRRREKRLNSETSKGSCAFGAKKQRDGSVGWKFPRQGLQCGGFLLKVYGVISYYGGFPAKTGLCGPTRKGDKLKARPRRGL